MIVIPRIVNESRYIMHHVNSALLLRTNVAKAHGGQGAAQVLSDNKRVTVQALEIVTKGDIDDDTDESYLRMSDDHKKTGDSVPTEGRCRLLCHLLYRNGEPRADITSQGAFFVPLPDYEQPLRVLFDPTQHEHVERDVPCPVGPRRVC
jgi:hypothetical protein